MKKWRNIWPFLGAVLLYAASVDYAIVPFLERRGFSFWAIFWVAVPAANLEVLGGFYFWRWFIWTFLPETEPVRDTVELAKNIIALLRKYGLLGTIIYEVRETFKWATNPNRFVNFIKRWGHFGMFVLGAESFVSGGRLAGTVTCASAKWKAGLVSLMLGNIIHVATTIWTWKLFFYLWDEYREVIYVLALILLLVAIYYYGRKWLKKNGKVAANP